MTVNYEATRCHMIKNIYLNSFFSLLNRWKTKDTLDRSSKTKCLWCAANGSNLTANAFTYKCKCVELQFSHVHFKMCEKFDIRNVIQNRLLIWVQHKKAGKRRSAPIHVRFVIAFSCVVTIQWEYNTRAYVATDGEYIFSRLSCIDLWDGYVW